MSRYFGIPLRNGLPLGLGTVATLRSGGAASWTPLTLFLAGEQGGWYDPSDLSTMFQDSAGTTPVTAVEQPVGLLLDKRLGALSALGVDQRSAGAVVVLGSSAAASYDTSTGAGLVTRGATVNDQQWVRYSGLTANSTYLVTFNRVSGSIAIRPGNHSALPSGTFGGTGPLSVFVSMGSSTELSITCATANSTASFESISVREVPGNHLIQPTSASRPTYSKRYNVLLATENLASSSWSKTRCTVSAVTAPDGSSAAWAITGNGASGNRHAFNTAFSNARPVSVDIYLKAGTNQFVQLLFAGNTAYCNIDLTTGAVTQSAGWTPGNCIDAGGGWWRFVNAGPASDTTNFAVGLISSGTALRAESNTLTTSVEVWRPDVRRTIHTQMGMPAYQRVTTATDYEESGFLPRLRFDGADDGMYSAASVNFSASDEMTVLAGLTKLSDAAAGILIENTATSATTPGAIAVFAPSSGAVNLLWRSIGSPGGAGATDAQSNFAAPTIRVLTGLGKIATDTCILRVNGAQVATSAGDQGTGNYSNAVLNVGRRNNASNPFNGDIFQLIVRGALTTGADLTSAEQYVAARTGVTL